MGTDGFGIYASDGAADTVARLKQFGISAVEEHISRVIAFGDGPVWSNVAEEALPAIDAVAQRVSGVPAIGSQVAAIADKFDDSEIDSLVMPAKSALEAIGRPNSGLRELWEQAGLVDEWLETIADLRLRLEGHRVDRQAPAQPPPVRSPGDVLIAPLRSELGGVDGLSTPVVVRSVSADGRYEIFIVDLFFDSDDPPKDVVALVTTSEVLEGYALGAHDSSGVHAGRIEGFKIDRWPMLLDDHSIAPSENPYPLAERKYVSDRDSPVFTALELPSGCTLADVSRDHFGRPWVPFSSAAVGPDSASSRVYARHYGSATPFKGNGRIIIQRRRRR